MKKKYTKNNLLKICSLFLLMVFSTVFISGCFKKEKAGPVQTAKTIELVYYKLFDEEDVMKPIIQQYQTKNPNIRIKYRKFDSSEEYYRTILNELAEGEGPDIFSVPNYWLKPNAKKVSPINPDLYDASKFEKDFVSVASKDAVFADPRDGKIKVFGFPLAVDTLAIYYNKDLYEDRVPSRGRPASTWEEFKDDVFKLTKADNSYERFEVAGTAMGRSDNIARAMDILYLLMLQYKVKFYDEDLTKAQFSGQNAVTENGVAINPATEALKLYTSFGLASQKNYSWNEYMVESTSPVKEMEAFARGKVATIFGYSYLYEQIRSEVEQLKSEKVSTINFDSVRIAPVPQVNDPNKSTEKRDAFANYFVETVSRNTENPNAAWDFLAFASNKDNAAYYNQKTHRPTARRDLIEAQKQDSVYGVFAEQVGYAESLDILDWDIYKAIFDQAISGVINKSLSVKDAVSKAQDQINKLIPAEGILAKSALPAKAPAAKTTSTAASKTTDAKK